MKNEKNETKMANKEDRTFKVKKMIQEKIRMI